MMPNSIVEEFQDNTLAWIASICRNLPSEDLCSLEIVEKVCREEIIETNVVADYSPSLRRYVYKNAGYRRFKKCFAIGRFGPFQDDLMVDISVELQKLNVDPSDAIEIFMPETLLQILQQKEGINRILAEYVLQGNFV
ncbi:uncharacterized protein LOC110460132 isoform X1 [Mizuhopecten yessoensis]|uniref:uncharacterized protein LOC110460132 isoform X1 n=1 Tax=Mizuhopecten yessoensis TaxID=6573 RepID=UPI000B458C4E|nr:uncharacterized protein LOC110460132 isoform X1 [Mizuhopecten yessoensis]